MAARIAQTEGDGTKECPITGYDDLETGCDNPFEDYNPDSGECECENGSEEFDCWEEGDEPEPDCDFEPCDDDDGEGGGGSGDGGGETDSVTALLALVEQDPFILVADTVPCDLIPQWSNLAETEVAQSILDRYPETQLQELATAAGAVVNMDEYTVTVDLGALPDSVDAGGVFDQIRRNLLNLTSGHPGAFSYYASAEEAMWMGATPLGTYFSINLPAFLSASVATSVFDTGSSWTFSTVRTTTDGSHPVSGHRTFIWAESGGTGTFTIRGVDRVSGGWWIVPDFWPGLFNQGDLVWQNFQQGLADLFGPSTVIGDPITYRPDWDQVEAILLGDGDAELLGCLS